VTFFVAVYIMQQTDFSNDPISVNIPDHSVVSAGWYRIPNVLVIFCPVWQTTC